MSSTGTPTSSPRAVIDRLLRATNNHDLDDLVDCFSPDYVNETPVHPLRGFTGREQVRRNWTQIFAAVPDLVAEVVALADITGSADNEGTVWTEWQMSGSRLDGTPHLMRGVMIFTVRDDQVTAVRFYLEPVETHGGNIDAAVVSHLAGRP
ncbi:MAG: nuclear transport factor 2 family protein [Actinomycetota bacterium]